MSTRAAGVDFGAGGRHVRYERHDDAADRSDVREDFGVLPAVVVLHLRPSGGVHRVADAARFPDEELDAIGDLLLRCHGGLLDLMKLQHGRSVLDGGIIGKWP